MFHKLCMLKAKIYSGEVKYVVRFHRHLLSTRKVSRSRLLKGQCKRDLGKLSTVKAELLCNRAERLL